jgi:hypothetical protein
MAADIRHSLLSQAVGDVLHDVWELVQKEFQFGRAELSAKLDTLVRKVAWIAVAGLFATMALLVLVEAAIFALADAGMALHWSCLLVGSVLAVVTLLAYVAGRSRHLGGLSPSRTQQHLTLDVRTAKEHLT